MAVDISDVKFAPGEGEYPYYPWPTLPDGGLNCVPDEVANYIIAERFGKVEVWFRALDTNEARVLDYPNYCDERHALLEIILEAREKARPLYDALMEQIAGIYDSRRSPECRGVTFIPLRNPQEVAHWLARLIQTEGGAPCAGPCRVAVGDAADGG